MDGWLKKIEDTIRGRELFRDGQSICVAVSGGLDSMVLLHALVALAPKWGWKLAVAHFNHKLRGPHSDNDEQLVRVTAEKLRLPVLAGCGEVKQYADQTGLSIEMAARKLRHDFLARTAVEQKAEVIALAHHAGDQVELFFLRLFRGAGPQGLAGMKWLSPSPSDPVIQLARPLLDQPKAALEAFAREQSIEFSEDASNASLDMRRNRIRHELIPLLEKHYQPALTQTTLRVMELIGREAELVTHAAEQASGAQNDFASLPVAVQRRRLQRELFKLNQSVDFELVEALRSFKTVSVSAGLTASCDSCGRVRLDRIEPVESNRSCCELDCSSGGQEHFGELDVSWSVEEVPGMQFDARANREYFDADKVGARIWLRHWQSGDRFQPSGAESEVKLQDLFTNLKVPVEERHKRVVGATSEGSIFWVEGLRIAERFKLDKQTTRRLKWEWYR